jgi:hypothetical protein
MARWGVKANKGTNNVQTVLGLTAAASSPRRAKVHDLSFGCEASPADNAFAWMIQRCSTAGTGSALTPNALDPADTLASTIVAKDTTTADPTLTASAFLYAQALNQRASFRWVAAPYSEIIIPATASNGIVLGLTAATTTSFTAGAQYEEL